MNENAALSQSRGGGFLFALQKAADLPSLQPIAR
jgi:hypothetical protein